MSLQPAGQSYRLARPESIAGLPQLLMARQQFARPRVLARSRSMRPVTNCGSRSISACPTSQPPFGHCDGKNEILRYRADMISECIMDIAAETRGMGRDGGGSSSVRLWRRIGEQILRFHVSFVGTYGAVGQGRPHCRIGELRPQHGGQL